MFAIGCPLLFDAEILDGTVALARSARLKVREHGVHLLEGDVCAAKAHNVIVDKSVNPICVEGRADLERQGACGEP